MKYITKIATKKILYIFLLLSLAYTTDRAMSNDYVLGTPDTDGDGDGDPVGNGYTFLIGEPLPLANDPNGPEFFNEMRVISNLNTEYWGSDNNSPWKDYTLPDEESKLTAAHLLDDLSAGDDYWYSIEFKYAICEYEMKWEEINEVLPTGTIITFGIGLMDPNDRIDADDIKKENHLSPLSTGVAPPDFSSTTSNYDWFSYSLDSQGDSPEWDIQTDTECVSDVIFYFEIPDIIPAGETLPQGNQWALSGYDDDGDFESVEPGDDGPKAEDDPTTDAVFIWEIKTKADTWGPLIIPEPNQSVLILVPALASLFLRKKRKRSHINKT